MHLFGSQSPGEEVYIRRREGFQMVLASGLDGGVGQERKENGI